MPEVDGLTLTEMASLVRRGAITSEELVSTYLARIAKDNGKVNALALVGDPTRTTALARAADTEAAKGIIRGPLHGVPVTIKDVCHVSGYRMSRGIQELRKTPSSIDATAVGRLKQAGAIVLGITNVPELCMAFETDNLLYGLTRNPHDLRRSAGGSSGGEAAAIAAGLSPAGLGSDACGSVRLPAHFNGVSGLKLTQGRVPLTGQFPNDRSGMFHFTSAFGPLGRYVEDVAVIGRVISGADGFDPDAVDVPFAPGKPVGEMRVAAFWEPTRASVSPAIRSAMATVCNALTSASVQVTPDCPPGLDDASDVLWRIFITGGDSGRAWKSMFEAMGKEKFTYALDALMRCSERVEMSVDQYRGDVIAMDRFRYQLAAFFRRYDALVTPVFTDVAFAHGTSMDDPTRYGFVFPFSLSGSPAVVVPIGKDPASGLPIGVQIVGPHWQEEQILRLARYLERELGPWQKAVL